MKVVALALPIVAFAFSGCYRDLSYADLSAKIDRDDSKSAPAIAYQGSNQKGHHFKYQQYYGPTLVPAPIRMRTQRLRIPLGSVNVRNQFDLSDKESKLRGYYIGVYGRDEFDRDFEPIQRPD